jgi:hypothetical protein
MGNTLEVFDPVPVSAGRMLKPPKAPKALPDSPDSKPNLRVCEYPNDIVIRKINNNNFFIE